MPSTYADEVECQLTQRNYQNRVLQAWGNNLTTDPCPVCAGSGRVPDGWECPNCSSTGKVQEVQDRHDPSNGS